MFDTFDFDRNPELYRQWADNLRRAANETFDAGLRAQLDQLAVEYERLAQNRPFGSQNLSLISAHRF
jgi:hypothetical protein